MNRYVIARTARQRPTLQHVLAGWHSTLCGLDIRGWSRAYQDNEIPQVICKKCLRIKEIQNGTPRV